MDRGLNDGLGDRAGGDSSPPRKEERTLAMSRPDVVVRSNRALGAEDGRPVIVVLGMHRSGTSLLSNILHYLGVDMADTTDHTGPKNAGGFWERPELTAIHDEILAAIDRPIGRASHVLPFPPAWWRRKEVQALKPKLIAYMREQLAKSSNPWGFKDPRTCRLLPLWWEVFRELNLRPIYVHALRSPAEASVSFAQKSSARKMSVASGELMWLTYNYDIVRYVTAEHPTVTVNYADWFGDGPAVAQRLVEELGIGEDLTAEDVVECVASIVNREYRHQVDGEQGLAPNIPIVTMLYKALTASDPLNSADTLALRRQLRLVDLFLKSLGSITDELDSATIAQRALVDEQRLLLENHTSVQQVATDQLAALTDQMASLAQRHAAAVEALKERDDRIVALETEQTVVAEKMTAARASLELAKQLGAKSAEVAEQEVRTRKQLAEELAAQERAAASLDEQLQLTTGRSTRLAEQLATTEQAVREAQERIDEATTREAQARAEAEAIRVQLAERDRHHGQALVEIGALRATLVDRDQQSSNLLARNRKFTAQLDAREQTIAALSMRDRELVADAGPNAIGFAWPVDASEAGVEGRVTSVDGAIRGEISIGKRSDVNPIVEIRVGNELVFAQVCTAPVLAKAGAGAWQFAVPWSRFAEAHAGREAVVRVAGFGIELGRVPIPADLRLYHMAPELIAAEMIGGTVAEAETYHRWIAAHEAASETALARSYRRDVSNSWPRITVVVHGDDAGPAAIAATVRSLGAQLYGQWEALCVDAPDDVAVLDPRARSVAAADLSDELAGYPDDALISFVEADDRLAPTALLHLVTAALESPDFALIYSDEDRIDPQSGVRALPHMKGDWSVDLALVQDYVSRLALVRRKRLVPEEDGGEVAIRQTILHSALAGDGAVIHLPFVLYHRAAENVDRDKGYPSVVAAVLGEEPEAHGGARIVASPGGRWRIEWPLPDPMPRVSLVVPTRDHVDLLKVCVEGFLHDTRYDDLEILIADNDSAEPETLAYLAKIANHPRVHVIPCPGAFNYSAINNLAASHATGTVIGLMNNDLKVIEPDWLRVMVSHVMRRDVGIVGAKLLHGDDTIQHAGVTLGISIASHLYKSFAPDAPGHHHRLLLTQDVSAVTAACLLIRKDVWDEVGGLDEEFPVAYNDIDLCLKVREAGYRILWTPDALVYHLESQSRGKDLTPEKRKRLDQDKARMSERWGEQLLGDPFHSPNLSDRDVDARLAFPSRAIPPWRQEARPPMRRGKKA